MDKGGSLHSIVWTDAAGEPFLKERAALAALSAALEYGAAPHRGVDVVVVDAARLAQLHGEFLGDPSETDVMTFDLFDPTDVPSTGPPMGPDGEIYVSAERAKAVAQGRGLDPGRELALYIVHGALHLCGLDDHAPGDRLAMRKAEGAVMATLGYDADDGPHDLDAQDSDGVGERGA